MIRSRNQTRIFKVTEDVLFAGSGCWSDIVELSIALEHKARVFEWESKRSLNVMESSFMLSQMLYMRRFQPYFSFSVLAGIDDEGKSLSFQYAFYEEDLLYA